MSPARLTATSIHIGSCAPSETIVAKTASSVYELKGIRRDDCGDVLVARRELFRGFLPCAVPWFAQKRPGGRTEHYRHRSPHDFCFDNQIIVTSEVQSLSRHSASDARAACAATQ
jgi:hypothetical protein